MYPCAVLVGQIAAQMSTMGRLIEPSEIASTIFFCAEVSTTRLSIELMRKSSVSSAGFDRVCVRHACVQNPVVNGAVLHANLGQNSR
jgi:hypothetical protein